MGKISTNPKSLESRERKAESAANKKAQIEKAKEDAYWKDDDKQNARKAERANAAVYLLRELNSPSQIFRSIKEKLN